MVALVVWGPKTPTTVQVHEGAHTLNVNVRAGTILGHRLGRRPRLRRLLRDRDCSSAYRTGTGRRSQGHRYRGKGIAAEFDAEIVRIKRQGYSTVSGVPVPGINAVAAPVFDGAGALALP